MQRSKGYADYGNSGSGQAPRDRPRGTLINGQHGGPDGPGTLDNIGISTRPGRALTATRRRLHGIGERLMAGPQRRAGGRFTLRVTPGGFATTGEPALRLDGTDVVVDESRRVAVAGTFSELADALGVDFGPPPDA
jgi:hypothetical protein